MDKVIKEFKENKYKYQLGYAVWFNKVYPRIEIYKNGELLSSGHRSDRTARDSFNIYAYNSSSFSTGTADNIKEMFIRLRKYSEIPQYIEQEYENIFLLYKLNNFKELNINT